MHNEMVCIVEMFATSTIKYPDGTSEKIANYNLVEYLPTTCFSEGIGKIHFIGDEKYINGVIEDIQTKIASEYSDKNLEFEVN